MGVELPKYLKPGAVNPLSYAEQMQKRKALWAKPAASANEESGPPGEASSQPEPVESQPQAVLHVVPLKPALQVH